MSVFDVSVEHAVDAVARDSKTPKEVRKAYAAAYAALEEKGCAAASYRLSGAGEHPRSAS